MQTPATTSTALALLAIAAVALVIDVSEDNPVMVADGVHIGTAQTFGEPIVSTDTLYPQIPEVGSLDPRDID